MRLDYFHSWWRAHLCAHDGYCENPPPTGGIDSGMPNAPRLLSFIGALSPVGAGWFAVSCLRLYPGCRTVALHTDFGENMAHFFLLGFHIKGIVFLRRDLDRDSFCNRQAEIAKPIDFFGVVRQKAQRFHAEVPQNLRSNPIFPQIRCKSQSRSEERRVGKECL